MTEAQKKFLYIVSDLWLSTETGDVFLQHNNPADGSVSWTRQGNILEYEGLEFVKEAMFKASKA